VKAEVGKVYRHYKGNMYTVQDIALHTETKEQLVVYKELKAGGQGQTWARPRAMFEEEIEVDGKKIHRFKKHSPTEK